MIVKTDIKVSNPAYYMISNLTYAQVPAWYGHTMQDLKLHLLMPEDAKKEYPCIVWLCGGGWMQIDKSAHMIYLADLARRGFVVASVEYRMSVEEHMPAQICDVKAAIRYLRAHAKQFHIDADKIGLMGESAGGYLTCLAALDDDPVYEVGAYLDYSSSVQAACPWYPPTQFATCEVNVSENDESLSAASLLLGKSLKKHGAEFINYDPVEHVTKDAPPFLILHGTKDETVPFEQSVLLHDKLEKANVDVTLVAIEGANHADLQFFQQEVWDMIADFFSDNL